MPNAFDTLKGAGSGGDSFVFDRYGDWLDMTITGYKDHDMSKAQDGSEIVLIVMGHSNGAVKNGIPQQPGPVSLIAGGDKGRKLFEAAQAAQAPDLEMGTRFVMTYDSERPAPGKPQPIKLYSVPVYERPKSGAMAGMAQQYGATQAPPAPTQAPPSYGAPQAPPQQWQQPPAAPQGPPPGYPPQPPAAPPYQAPQGTPDGGQVPLEWQQQPPAQAPGYGAPQGPPQAPQAPPGAAPSLFPAEWAQQPPAGQQ